MICLNEGLRNFWRSFPSKIICERSKKSKIRLFLFIFFFKHLSVNWLMISVFYRFSDWWVSIWYAGTCKITSLKLKVALLYCRTDFLKKFKSIWNLLGFLKKFKSIWNLFCALISLYIWSKICFTSAPHREWFKICSLIVFDTIKTIFTDQNLFSHEINSILWNWKVRLVLIFISTNSWTLLWTIIKFVVCVFH